MTTEPQKQSAQLTKQTKRTVRKKVRLPREIMRGEPPETLTQTKALRALMLLSQSAGLEATIYEFPFELLRDLLNIRDDQLLKEELYALRGRTWDWPGRSGVEGWVSPIPNVTWEKGVVRWEVSQMFMELIRRVSPRGYVDVAWDVIAEFSSLYGLRIWEICAASVHSSGYETTTPKMSLAELRVKLGVPANAYRAEGQSGALLHFCVKKPLAEVLQIGGLEIVFEREGRGPTAQYWFRIKGRKPRQPSLPTLAPGLASQVRKLDLERSLKQRIQTALDNLNDEDRAKALAWMKEEEGYSQIPDDKLNLQSYAGRLRGIPGLSVTIPDRVP